ncbi:MAG: mandelate racemase/muconate lactonizing enzyme family protein [Planctomycetota bacterium]
METRVPLKFGTETLTSVTCARARVVVEDRQGQLASGWGETPLSVQWVWPSQMSYAARHAALLDFTEQLAASWADFAEFGHPMEIGHAFQEQVLPTLLNGFNRDCQPSERMPLLAGLVCCSPFDLALHDAYGNVHAKPVYETYNADYMNYDLTHYVEPAEDATVDFSGKYPADYMSAERSEKLPVWHLVGGLDPLDLSETNGNCPDDEEPVILSDWMDRDGIRCLKIKLRGNDATWDYQRLVSVGQIARTKGEYWLTADFNCMVSDPAYVNDILDRLREEESEIFDAILYVEQPFPYDLEVNRIDVHSVSSRKPLLMDESAHNWELVRLGRSLGWTGVALKTCKTQTGAILSLSWAKAHGMYVMVQDLTNPMLAQIPHVLLAAHAGTMMGVESNAMQFYPRASDPEAQVHPELYRRRSGQLRLDTLHGSGFGYRLGDINRKLDSPVKQVGVTAF